MTKPDFATFQMEDRRLTILRVLMESTAYTANEFLLQGMAERFGHVVSADRFRTDLTWLDEQGLITLEVVADVRIARLTERGEDVARGRAEVPGVKRPRAG